MKHSLGILRKDAVHQSPLIAGFVFLLIGFSLGQPGSVTPGTMLVSVLLPLACGVLLTNAIHQEGPASDTGYWRIRPFSTSDVVVAKALFLAVFIHLPVFLLHVAVLGFTGFPPWEYLDALVGKQLFFAALLVLPAAAVAAVTRNTSQALITGVLLVGSLLTLSSLMESRNLDLSWGGLEWIRTTAVAAVAGAFALGAVAVQYRNHRLLASRALLLLGALLALFVSLMPPVQAAFHLQARLAGTTIEASSLRILPDLARSTATPPQTFYRPQPFVPLELPVQVESVPAGTEIATGWSRVRIARVGAEAWDSGWRVNAALHDIDSGTGWVRLLIPTSIYRANRGKPVHLSGQIDLTVLRQEAGSVPCIDLPATISCVSPLSGPAKPRGTLDYALYPTSPWFAILKRVQFPVPWVQPIAHVERAFDFGNVLLEKWEVSRP